MSHAARMTYALICYAVFLLSFLYAVGFLGRVFVPKSIDDGSIVDPGLAVAVDVSLLTLFALQTA